MVESLPLDKKYETAYQVIPTFFVTLVFCFGPTPKFCSFDLDLAQAEQKSVVWIYSVACIQRYIWTAANYWKARLDTQDNILK